MHLAFPRHGSKAERVSLSEDLLTVREKESVAHVFFEDPHQSVWASRKIKFQKEPQLNRRYLLIRSDRKGEQAFSHTQYLSR
jgi:uncharacterized membrane protein